MKKVEKMAKKYGILYSVLPDCNRKDGLSEVIFHTEAVPRVNMMIQKLKFGKIATFDDYLKNGDEKSLGKLMDFLKKQQGNEKSHTIEGDKVNSAIDGLIEKVGMFAMEKKAISVDQVKENFSINGEQAESVIRQLETIGVLGSKNEDGTHTVMMDKDAFINRVRGYQDLAERMRAVAASKNANLSDVTISKKLIIEENDHAVKTRVPGTWGEEAKYVWLRKENIMEIHGGKTMLALKNLVNALYCKDASKKVRAAKAVLAKQGKYIAAFAPFGYQKSEDDKHMLVPDPVTAPVVQLIFELAIKGMKYTEIANYLNNNGYDSIFEYYQKIGVKRCYERDIGEHMWSASTVMEILYNEVYIGSVINNKTADNIDTGHQVVQRDKEDWIIVENCHEPLVSVEDFKLAHKMIARREVTKRKPNGKWRKSYIRCGICGKGLYKYGNKSSYRCHNGHVSRIRGEELEATLLDIARNMALAQLQEFELKTDGGNCPDNLEREIESLKKSKAHYAKLKFEIYDDYTKTNITRDQMAKKTAEVKQKIAEIESLITEKQETLDMQRPK